MNRKQSQPAFWLAFLAIFLWVGAFGFHHHEEVDGHHHDEPISKHCGVCHFTQTQSPVVKSGALVFEVRFYSFGESLLFSFFSPVFWQQTNQKQIRAPPVIS